MASKYHQTSVKPTQKGQPKTSGGRTDGGDTRRMPEAPPLKKKGY